MTILDHTIQQNKAKVYIKQSKDSTLEIGKANTYIGHLSHLQLHVTIWFQYMFTTFYGQLVFKTVN